jgi:hypothetical protein
MDLEELTRFDSAVEPLWAYPLDRPGDAEQELLAYVSGLLPDQPLPGLGISPPEAPDYSMFADYPADAFEKAAQPRRSSHWCAVPVLIRSAIR